MARRDPYDRNTDWFRDYYYAERVAPTREPGERGEQEALEAYRSLHSKGNFYRTLAEVGFLVSGAYLAGRVIPRDVLRSAFHHLGVVGRKGIEPFQAATRKFSGALIGGFPEYEGISRAAANLSRTKYRNLELIDLLTEVAGFERTLGPGANFPAGSRAARHGIFTAKEVAEHHIAQKFTRSHESIGRLRYATVGDVFANANLKQQIGEKQFKVLKQAKDRGLVTDDLVLDTGEIAGFFKNEYGGIVDSRWAKPSNIAHAAWRVGRGIQIPLIGFRPADFIANMVRPFTKGKFFAELGCSWCHHSSWACLWHRRQDLQGAGTGSLR